MQSRHNLTFKDEDWRFLESLKRESGRSISSLLIHAAKKAYKDPLSILLEEEKKLSREMREIELKKKEYFEKKESEDI